MTLAIAKDSACRSSGVEHAACAVSVPGKEAQKVVAEGIATPADVDAVTDLRGWLERLAAEIVALDEARSRARDNPTDAPEADDDS